MTRRRTPTASPWLRDTDPDTQTDPLEGASTGARAVVLRTGPARPQPGVSAPPPARRLGVFTPHPDARLPRLWVVGTHGGAGETTLAARLTDSIGNPGGNPGGNMGGNTGGTTVGTGHRWPRPSPQAGAMPVPVLLCARTHSGGLATAQDAMRTWASGETGVDGLEVVGIVFVPDAPGRLPRTLADQVKVVAGGVGHAWVLSWSEDARLGLPAPADRAWRRFTSELGRCLPPPRAAQLDAPVRDGDLMTTRSAASASTPRTPRPLGVYRAAAVAERSPR